MLSRCASMIDLSKTSYPQGALQPAQENTVLSPKTDPLWSLSNSKYHPVVSSRVNARWITWTSNRGSTHALKLTRRRVQSTTWIKHFITNHCSGHGVKIQSSKNSGNKITSASVNITGGHPWCHHLSSPIRSTPPATIVLKQGWVY
jgi:hypothetical protein